MPASGSATESTYTSTAGVSGERCARRSRPLPFTPAACAAPPIRPAPVTSAATVAVRMTRLIAVLRGSGSRLARSSVPGYPVAHRNASGTRRVGRDSPGIGSGGGGDLRVGGRHVVEGHEHPAVGLLDGVGGERRPLGLQEGDQLLGRGGPRRQRLTAGL